MEQWNRDKLHATPNTPLNAATLVLDNWAKMNVHLAKLPFHIKTLCKALENICLESGVAVPNDDSMFEHHRECYHPVLASGEQGPLLGKFNARLDAVRELVNAKGKNPKQDPALFSKITLLEYQAAVHDLFIEVLMNKEMHFCAANMDSFKAHLKRKLEFFG